MWGRVDGAEYPAHIAVRSAPDPTLDMDLRVGNFLLVELLVERRLVRNLKGKTRFSNNVVLG